LDIKAETQKEILGTDTDYRRRSTKISGMEKFRNETITRKMKLKEDIIQEIEQFRWHAISCDLKMINWLNKM
jgi:hypothetical protein